MLESLFNKIAGLKDCNFIKKRIQHRCFPVNIAKFLRTVFFRIPLVAASANSFFYDHVHTLRIDFVPVHCCFAMTCQHNMRNIAKWTVQMLLQRYRTWQKWRRLYYRLKFQCLLIGFRVLIGPYSILLTCVAGVLYITRLENVPWHFNTLLAKTNTITK